MVKEKDLDLISFAQRTVSSSVSFSGCLFYNWVYNFSIHNKTCNLLNDRSNPLEALFTMVFFIQMLSLQGVSFSSTLNFDSPYGLNEFPRCWTPPTLYFWQPTEVLTPAFVILPNAA